MPSSTLGPGIADFCGHGLVVEHDLAKVETGVRFSLAASNSGRGSGKREFSRGGSTETARFQGAVARVLAKRILPGHIL